MVEPMMTAMMKHVMIKGVTKVSREVFMIVRSNDRWNESE